MKNIMKNKKIIAVLIALVVLAGIIVAATVGFNFDLKFQKTKKIELYLGKTFEISEIEGIVKEVMPEQEVSIQKVEIYEDSMVIIANNITEEQKNNIINKVNEKYETELSAEDIEVISIPNTRGRDFIKPYISPFAIATAIILVYMSIRYRKLNVVKMLVKTVGILVIAQILLFSVIAITRIPVGRLTIPMIIFVYLTTLYGITNKYEKELDGKIENK